MNYVKYRHTAVLQLGEGAHMYRVFITWYTPSLSF